MDIKNIYQNTNIAEDLFDFHADYELSSLEKSVDSLNLIEDVSGGCGDSAVRARGDECDLIESRSHRLKASELELGDGDGKISRATLKNQEVWHYETESRNSHIQLEDVALFIGEVLQDTSKPLPIPVLRSFSKFENCFESCLSSTDKEFMRSLSNEGFPIRTKNADEVRKDDDDDDDDVYNNDNDDDVTASSHCALQYLKNFLNHLKTHASRSLSSSASLPNAIKSPSLQELQQNAKHSRGCFSRSSISGSLGTSCQYCAVALAFSHSLGELNSSRKSNIFSENEIGLDDEDIYSSNSVVLRDRSGSNIQTLLTTIQWKYGDDGGLDNETTVPKAETGGKSSLYRAVGSHFGRATIESFSNVNEVSSPSDVGSLQNLTGIRNAVNNNNVPSLVTGSNVMDDDDIYNDNTSNLGSNSFYNSDQCTAVEDEKLATFKSISDRASVSDLEWNNSEILPCEVKSSGSDDWRAICETMPPDSRLFKKKEEKRKSRVLYGSMENVLELIRGGFKLKLNERLAEGIVLSKYQHILKIKDKSYDDMVHYERVTKPLGRGSSGDCYLACDNSTDAHFCIKNIKKFNPSEIEAWAKLSDIDGVPNFYGIVFHLDVVCIFQEFIDGPTLQARINDQSSLKLGQSLEILRNLLLTLSKLHERHVIHDDIKADNIILGDRQVLVDFGLSNHAPSGIKSGVSPQGSQCHWSPEKAASEGYGFKSDVWAAVAVFVHMLSGIEPWRKRFDNKSSLHWTIKKKSPPLEDIPENLPNEVKNLIVCGWEVDVDKRRSAEQLLKHEAFTFVDRESPGLIDEISYEKLGIEEELRKEIEESTKLLSELAVKMPSTDNQFTLTSSTTFQSVESKYLCDAIPWQKQDSQQSFVESKISLPTGNNVDSSLEQLIHDAVKILNRAPSGSSYEICLPEGDILTLVKDFEPIFKNIEKQEKKTSSLGHEMGQSSSSLATRNSYFSSSSSTTTSSSSSTSSNEVINKWKIPANQQQTSDLNGNQFRPVLPVMVENVMFSSNEDVSNDTDKYGREDASDRKTMDCGTTSMSAGKKILMDNNLSSLLPRMRNFRPNHLSWQSSRAGITVEVLLEENKIEVIYALYLYPDSNIRWAEVAQKASNEVHKRNITSFYLVLYPSGQTVNTTECLQATLMKLYRGEECSDNTNSNASCLSQDYFSCSCNGNCPLCCGDNEIPMDGFSQSPKTSGDSVTIKAKVVEIQNVIQQWEWKVENGKLGYNSHKF